MNCSKIISAFNYASVFVSLLVAGLVGFNWTAFLTPDQALQIVTSLNGLGIAAKAWMATAEQMAKSIAAGASQ